MYLLNEDELDSKLNKAKLTANLADYAAKDAESYKKAKELMDQVYRQQVSDRRQLALDHPIISGIESGIRTGKTTFINLFVIFIILGILTKKLNLKVAQAILQQVGRFSARLTLLIAGVSIPLNYITRWIDNKIKNGGNKMENESLGLRLLSKLDRLSNGQHIYEVDELENDGTAEEAAEATSDETSEALKKLRGHLYRFQEKDDEYKGAGLGLHTAIGAGVGAVGGRQLARHSYMKNSGAGEAIKATKQGMKDSVKNLKHFAHKANTAKAQSKVAKITGNVAKAQQLQRTADASARAAQKAKTMVNAGKKTISGLKGAANAAGRAGLVKGGLIGGLALGGAYGLQQLHKRFKNK